MFVLFFFHNKGNCYAIKVGLNLFQNGRLKVPLTLTHQSNT